ncbi:Na+/H+ antiporter subunit E [Nocardiopsis xinjiangensis]|uniref:Na+/H+ antiporter subunit E n=1 Tax=Nocardiopsis xinjiangensis TaxID=124285 RepID=UPI00034C32BD|nr:Na+/H+ antiporter subunit E [Nocardiopsis xinjiangensis]
MTVKSVLNWILGILWIPVYLAYDLLTGSLRVGWEILTPGSRISAAFVEVPLRCRTDFEVSTLANLVSLTPGSLTVAARQDPATVWVYSMYTHSHGSTVRYVHAMEDRLLRATRPAGKPPRAEDLERDEGGQRL